MKLYVMRHGPAEDSSNTGRDADRALTLSGRDRVRSVARSLVSHGRDEGPFVIVSSPLVRAVQTAEIVAATVDLKKRVEAEPKARAAGATGAVEIRREMAPGGDAFTFVLDAARAGKKRLMVVGHEPDLSMLVTRLIGVPPKEGMLKAMVVAIKLTPDTTNPTNPARDVETHLRFVLHPKTLNFDRE